MSKNLISIITVTFCLVMTQCSHNPASPVARELTDLEKQLVQTDNKFGLKLFQEIIQQEKNKNVFISPLSVSMALGMTLNGADGETQAAMENTLELTGMTIEEINQSYKSLIMLLTQLDPKVIFNIANSIWYRQGYTFEQDFIDLNMDYFSAVVQALDFNDPNSADVINAWVKDNTNDLIQQIVDPPIDPHTIMFLINAIYFKGTWTYEFEEDLTQDDLFNLPDGSQKTCRMMQIDGELQYIDNAAFQAIDLPYGDELFSMTILLPKPQVDIDSLISELSQEKWNLWLESLTKNEVNLHLPKFKFAYEVPLNEVLKALGMGVAFDPFQADFTKMYTGPNNAYISKVKHKTFVEVNEEGTEAAAVTSVEIGVTSIGPGGIVMRVNRPFIFMIRENHSQTIFFIGKVIEPKIED